MLALVCFGFRASGLGSYFSEFRDLVSLTLISTARRSMGHCVSFFFAPEVDSRALRGDRRFTKYSERRDVKHFASRTPAIPRALLETMCHHKVHWSLWRLPSGALFLIPCARPFGVLFSLFVDLRGEG